MGLYRGSRAAQAFMGSTALPALFKNGQTLWSNGAFIQLSGFSVNENAIVGAAVGTFSVVNGTGTYTYTLTDNAGGRFAVNNSTGALTVASGLDFETNQSHLVTVSATNGGTPITRVVNIQVLNDPADDPDLVAPTITSGSSFSVAENATLSFALTADEPVTWAIVGGADATAFEISGSTLRWVSNGTKNFEAGQTSFVVQVQATDLSANVSDIMTITGTLTNVLEVTLVDLTFSAVSFTSGAASGTKIADISGKAAGSTLSISPNDGRVTFNGDQTQLLVGLTAWTPGSSVEYTITETHPDASNTPHQTTVTITANNSLWYDAPTYDLMTAGADLNNDRYFLPSLGNQLVQNGNFDTALVSDPATGWSKSAADPTATVAISDGVASLTGGPSGSASAIIDQSMPVVIGKLYKLTLDYTAPSGGATGLQIGASGFGSVDYVTDLLSATTTKTYYFTASASTLYFRAWRNPTSAATLDNVSIKEVILDKTNGKYPKRAATFAEWFAFTASSTAARSYTDANGTIKNDLAADAPRFTWANGKRQFRLEDQRTNYLWPSTIVTGNGTWVAQGLTVSNVTIGGRNASRVTCDAGEGGFTRLYRLGLTSGKTWSFDFRPGSGIPYIHVRHEVMGATYGRCINMASPLSSLTTSYYDGVNPAGAPDNAKVTALPNGWYRYEQYIAAANGENILIYFSKSADNSYMVASGSEYIDFANMQLENGGFASERIPTTTGEITRATENAQFSSLIDTILQRSKGSIVVRLDLDYKFMNQCILGIGNKAILHSGSPGNWIQTYGATELIHDTGAGSDLPMGVGVSWDDTAPARTLVHDGTAVTRADGRGTLAANSALGRAPGGGSTAAFGSFDFIGISPERVTDTQLQTWAVAA